MTAMKIDVGNFSGNIYNVMRSAGYHPDKFQREGKKSFSRSLLGDRYPRFHIYYSEEGKRMDIHLDHKAPKYENAPDHGAEYDGSLIEKETERLKDFFEN